MTTIVAVHKLGVMCSDSRSSDPDTWVPCTKIFRIEDYLIGFAGDLTARKKYLDWINGGRKGRFPRFTKKEAFEAIVLRHSGVYSMSDDGFEQLIERGFHAAGSGGQAAFAALMLGAAPEKAVAVACYIDQKSGGDVQTVYLKGK